MEPHELSDASVVFDFVRLFAEDARAGRVRSLDEYQARFPGRETLVAQEYAALLESRAAAQPSEGEGSQPVPPDVPGFQLQRLLGRGGQASVWLARDELGRSVALKVFPGLGSELGTRQRARLRREVEIVAQLDHPGLCDVHRADLAADPPWVSMRYVEGETLAQVVARRRADSQASAPGAEGSDSGSSATTDLPCGPRSPVELRRVLAVVEQAARALHAAHDAGVVHRDVKPANIMVDLSGRAVVLDFGLARQHEHSGESLTRSTDAFGTPGYMSPEQVTGGAADLDVRTDVYSLGATLYECLTLERPHAGLRGWRLEQAICQDEPRDPTRINHAISADLRVVLSTAMAKDLSQRYATALELADDLRRVRLYEPVAARAAGPLVHARRWLRRNPALAVAALGLVLSLVVGLSVSLTLLSDVSRERDAKQRVAEGLRAEALAGLSLTTLDEDPVDALLLALEAARLQGRPSLRTNDALLAALQRCRLVRRVTPEGSGLGRLSLSADGRIALFARYALTCLDSSDGSIRWRAADVAGCFSAAFNESGTRVVAACKDGRALVLDARDGSTLLSLEGHSGWVRKAAFAPGGESLVTVGDDGDALLFDARDGQLLARMSGHSGALTDLAFSPDGLTLATLSGVTPAALRSSDGTARLWSLPSGLPLAELSGHEDKPTALAFSPHGALLATAAQDGIVRIWSASPDESGAALGALLGELTHPATVHSLTWFDDTQLLCTFDPGDIAVAPTSGAWVWDVVSGERVGSFEGGGHRAVYTAALAADGQLLLTGSYDGLLRVFERGREQPLTVLRGGVDMVFDVGWSADGEHLLSAWGGGVDIWRLGPPPGLIEFVGHEAPLLDLVLTPDGSRLISASSDGTARLWDLTDGRPLAVLGQPGAALIGLVLLDERRVVSAACDGVLRVFELPPVDAFEPAAADSPLPVLVPTRVLEHDGGELTAVAGSARSGRLVSGDGDGTIVLWDATSWQPVRRLVGHTAAISVLRCDPTGRRVLSGAADRSVRVWDAADGRLQRVLRQWNDTPETQHQRTIFDIDISDDGQLAVAACEDQRVRYWSLDDGRLIDEQVHSTPGLVRFLDDRGTTLVASKWGRRISLLSPEEGLLFSSDVYHHDRITSVDRQPGGDLVLSGSLDGSARLWNWRTGQQVLRLTGHDGPLHVTRFTPDGRGVLTAGQDGVVRLWPVDVLALAREHAPMTLDAAHLAEYGLGEP